MIEALLFRLRADSVGLTLGPHKVRGSSWPTRPTK